MPLPIWTPTALASEARRASGRFWRMVEAQHVISTAALVDTQEEQILLEELLEKSKPPIPANAAHLDYLLAAPFRYLSPVSTRFRRVGEPGVFCAAEHVSTAAAELGFWRWRFLVDAPALESLGPVTHTAFGVQVDARAIDLRKPPFDRDAAHWMHPTDYSVTQTLAAAARSAELQAIRYASVRDPDHGGCLAILDPAGFSEPRHHSATQTWHLHVTRARAVWVRDTETRLEFRYG